MKFEFKDRVGEVYITNQGYEIKIIEYFSCHNCTIQFNNGAIIKNIKYSQVKKGSIKNPYHPSIYNVGYHGLGIHSTNLNGKMTKVYITWTSMLQRCYSTKYNKRFPTYKGCTVDERWHNFQVFAAWFKENYKTNKSIKLCLDKDILVKGNKSYSPETCCFVPEEINKIYTFRNAGDKKLPNGVQRIKNGFVVQISIKGKSTHVATCTTIEEASKFSINARNKYLLDTINEYKEYLTEEVYNILKNKIDRYAM
jgi:hypothetical protein